MPLDLLSMLDEGMFEIGYAFPEAAYPIHSGEYSKSLMVIGERGSTFHNSRQQELQYTGTVWVLTC